MLQIRTTRRLDQIELGLRAAAERHGGSLLASSHVGKLLGAGRDPRSADAVTFALCFSDRYAPLLQADIRFSAFLPSRVAVWAQPDGVFLETISPREYCRLIHRPEIEPLAAALEDTLLAVMKEAAQMRPHEPETAEHPATEEQINMRAALPQRIDCHGTKVEELAGTGVIDSQGG